MADSWNSAQRTEKLPTIAMTPTEYQRVHDYKEKHNMKMAEVIRKAVSLFLDAEDAKGEIIVPIVEVSKPKSKRGKKAKAAQS